MTFWEHLDDLRKIVFRVGIVVLVLAVLVFMNKTLLFDIILAPHQSDFILYRFLNQLGAEWGMPTLQVENFKVDLINIQLASQFMIHVNTSLNVALLLAMPYVLYSLFGFIRPALYEVEKRVTTRVLSSAIFLFFMGILLNYFLIFPMSFHFLATYQVSELVVNQISLSSYISTFILLSILLGISFEMPVLIWMLSRLGIVDRAMLKKYRKHSLVIILCIAAVITPSADIFTLLLVTVPIYLLYEMGILVASSKKSVF